MVYFGQPVRSSAARRIREMVTAFPVQTVGVDEAYLIAAAVHATRNVSGALAEVGVYRGGTARVICESKGDRTLHLFDTFEGLPPPTAVDIEFERGQYACPLPAVRKFLDGCAGLHFHEGLFPATAAGLENERFSFVPWMLTSTKHARRTALLLSAHECRRDAAVARLRRVRSGQSRVR